MRELIEYVYLFMVGMAGSGSVCLIYAIIQLFKRRKKNLEAEIKIINYIQNKLLEKGGAIK